MTNFIIAVVGNTFERVQSTQKLISVRHKAELNQECYILKANFLCLPEYKVIVFSTNKLDSKLDNDELEEASENILKFINKETREIKKDHSKLL